MAKRRARKVMRGKPAIKKVVRKRPAVRRKMAMGKKVPVLAWLVLIVAVLWLLNAFGVLAYELPWLPLVLTLFAIGMVWKKFKFW